MNDDINTAVSSEGEGARGPVNQGQAPVVPPPAEKIPPQEPPKKRRGCFFWSCLTVLLLFVLMVLGFIGLIVWACTSEDSGMEEESMKSGFSGGKGKIAIIAVDDVISCENSFSNSNPEVFEKLIQKAEKDSSVKGIILSLNTPGGEVTATDDMYRAVRKYRKKTGKPVVALMNSVAASGGFYLAMSCDKVLASPMTLTGSIGVIISAYNFSVITGRIGIEREVYKSGEMKDMLNSMRERTKEEKAIVNALVKETWLRFVDIVAESRKLPPEKLRKSPLTDGRVLSAKQALDAGLIDGFGRQEEACHLVEQLAKVKKDSLEPVRYKKKIPFMDLLMESKAGIGKLSLELPGMTPQTKIRSGFLYFLSPDMVQ